MAAHTGSTEMIVLVIDDHNSMRDRLRRLLKLFSGATEANGKPGAI